MPCCSAAFTRWSKSSNVPNENIERAIKRGTGELEGVDYEEITYEGYGPGGAAILIAALTDNKNRTVAEIRHLFSKHNGSLGESGSVAWMFDTRGYFAIEKTTMSEEEFMELAVELDADDLSTEEEAYEIFTSPESYIGTKEELERQEMELAVSELARIPQTYLELDQANVETNLKLLEVLEEHDDVQNVWSNFNVDSETLTARST